MAKAFRHSFSVGPFSCTLKVDHALHPQGVGIG